MGSAFAAFPIKEFCHGRHCVEVDDRCLLGHGAGWLGPLVVRVVVAPWTAVVLTMETTWNVASAMRPTRDHEAFCRIVCETIAEYSKAKCLGIFAVRGPGCINYGLLLESETEREADEAAKMICLALQPAKFSKIEPDHRLVAGTFKIQLEEES